MDVLKDFGSFLDRDGREKERVDRDVAHFFYFFMTHGLSYRDVVESPIPYLMDMLSVHALKEKESKSKGKGKGGF